MQFKKDQLAAEREKEEREREREREREKEEREREREREREEREKERQEREREEREKEREKEEKESERVFLLKMKELEIQSAMSQAQHSAPPQSHTQTTFDVAKNVRLLPKFDEGDVESFFVTFEGCAERLRWPEECWTVMLRTVFTGEAQKVCSQIPVAESYEHLKQTVLAAYELVPEAYRQKFRTWRKKPGQTYAGFSREKEQWFDRWYRALQQDKTFEMLRETILLEEFKSHVPVEVRIHLDEQKVTKLRDAGVMADSYELAHRKSGSGAHSSRSGHPDRGSVKSSSQSQVGSSSVSQSQGGQWSRKVWDKDVVCYYCHAKGHVKSKCVKFRKDQEQSGGKKPVGLVHVGHGMVGSGVKGSHGSVVRGVESELACVEREAGAPSLDNCVGDRGRCSSFLGGLDEGVVLSKGNLGGECPSSGHADGLCPPGEDRTGKVGQEVAGSADSSSVLDSYRGFVSQGKVSDVGGQGNRQVTILRDTGAAQSLVLACVAPVSKEGEVEAKALIQGVQGCYVPVPLRRVKLDSKLVTGVVTVGVVPSLPIDGVHFLLGNDLAGDRVDVTPIVVNSPVVEADVEALGDEFPGLFPACVVTRAQSRKAVSDVEKSEKAESTGVWLSETFFKDLDSGVDSGLGLSRPTLVEQQRADPELDQIRQYAMSEAEANDVPGGFYVRNDILMRKWRNPRSPASDEWSVVHQVVLPRGYRSEVLRLAHEAPMAGHVGIRKTRSRIMAHFYWPRMYKDVAQFCRTCHTCQVVGKPQPAIKPAPLMPVPAFEEPFTKIMVDCVGPLPRTKSGFQFLLTVMDVSTRFPEAVPLKRITAESVVGALIQFFTRYGLAKEVQTDQGSNFMSGLFRQVLEQLGIRQLRSSAYHPESQGALERYHQTLKTMLRAYCTENPDSWDKGIPLVLFATRSATNESTGYSPFELVYGHEVRGPLKFLKERLLGEEGKETPNLLDYVSEFRERLFRACEVARDHLKESQGEMKAQFDRRAEKREFKPGDKVLALLPLVQNPLTARFQGPYTVRKKLNPVNYVIDTPDRRKPHRVCHINMLKRYFEREPANPVGLINTVQDSPVARELPGEVGLESGKDTDGEMPPVKLSNSEVLRNIDAELQHLPPDQRQDLCSLLCQYKSVCSDTPGLTTWAVHDVDVGDSQPIKQHPYRLNPSKAAMVRQEVQYMLQNNLIEPSQSCYSSPVVLAPKADGTQRMCFDYRKVNAVTRTDSYPIPRLEECIDSVGRSKYVTRIDLLKGYWQVPMTDRAKEVSSFVTQDSLFSCRVMPYGMKNSGATFQRLMNKVLAGLSNCKAYIDDVIVYSDTWAEHYAHLKALFARLQEANLVINLKKCEFAKATVTCLGHVVGKGQVLPRQAKVQCIVNFPSPKNKRELMRFLGMSGFYRKFCANYSTLVAPLTNLLRKDVKFVWSDRCQDAFDKLKAVLGSDPVLAAPDFGKPFKLAIDASDVGVGAVLLQESEDGIDRPVSYYSRKLDRHQRAYSTIEKEALALVLAVQHFEVYLTSCTGDIVVFTDHNPLVFLEKFRTRSRKLFRWSLLLQPYSLKIEHIRGRDNVIADALSRV
ncbi:RNase H-like domain-containing protein [Breoghania sp.]|uniref:RNase H-like domain-containing protein n=1 Tax=Breoghania sp. TaxID=2065378 RepID=UPI0026158185|nr:RNase H-like domain-containing protein [Breoghania sp.]MDJ0933722.1 RNase H-like domain-containing protein [Breoghania sp.]